MGEKSGSRLLGKLPYSNFPKMVYVLFAARVVNSLGNFVYPFMTYLLTQKMGMAEDAVGEYLLWMALMQLVGSIIGGKISDVLGRRNVIVISMISSGIFTLSCVFWLNQGGSMGYLPWALMIASLFRSVAEPAKSAMTNDLTTAENRRAVFSFLYLGINVGAAAGSLIAGILFKDFMIILFVGDALATILTGLLFLFFIKETKPSAAIVGECSVENSLVEETIEEADPEYVVAETIDERAESGSVWSALLRRPYLILFTLLNAVYGFMYAQTGFSLPLQIEQVFGSELGATYYGTFNMINCIYVLASTTLITVITRRNRPITNASIAGVFYALGFGMIYISNGVIMFFLSTILWTTGEILCATNVGVYIANHTPSSHRGRFSAITKIISSTGKSISPYIMGGFIVSYGVRNVWPIIFVLGLITGVAMMILGNFEKRKYK